ncbi:dihydrolipoamide acetyltransferase family protein [Streptosporangium carneum]|uniref:Dihydrolipoamide acetyltransferase component of pyruvate dehydrogenase complex n=3 Tax=Streptosporangium carneum TaxID=47481 RepID=A0A9W6I1Y5_9ACTN|nr:dihydrolipoamide acetyltransferase family protein [Streptosporangium carneum]GLK10516.1 dihydrolipoamide acetyltransferase component of pyruvate dehydrogenase complex [Streptosporangium carneum]
MTTATAQTFLLPDVGEGLTEADIVVWRVAVGDTVTVNQIIVDIETAKSVVELPSPYAGEVVELLAAEGQVVAVGSPIIAIRTADAQAAAPAAPAEGEAGGPEPKLLVGYGARDAGRSRRRRGAAPSGAAAPAVTPPAAPAVTPPAAPSRDRPRAKPPVRKLAKVLGVDLAAVEPTGPDGTVVRADVLRASESGGRPASADPAPAVAADGSETRIPIKGVRKHTAAAMVASAFTAPHVTEFVTVDVTKTLELRELVQRRREFRDTKLTPLAFVARAYLRALARIPTATARWDEAAQEIVVPAGVNLGFAVATPRGLMVPNVKDAHTLGLLDLANAINELAATARAGRTTPEAMAGGSTTITNVGVFGVDTGTPILNPGETAILAVGAIRRQPWVVEDAAGERIEPRSILQLALSFDHRVLDGAEGSQVLGDTAALLAEPGLAVL